MVFDRDREPPRPPARSVRVREDGSALRIDFPALGWRGGGSCALLLGGVLGAAGLVLALSACLGGGEDPEPLWLSLPCPLLALAGGTFLVACGWREWRRPGGVVEVSAGAVRASEAGVAGRRPAEWRREQLAGVRFVRDAEEGCCLQLDLADGSRARLFGGQHGLEWVAWRLRQALRLPEGME